VVLATDSSPFWVCANPHKCLAFQTLKKWKAKFIEIRDKYEKVRERETTVSISHIESIIMVGQSNIMSKFLFVVGLSRLF
jgi:hypothetical protein